MHPADHGTASLTLRADQRRWPQPIAVVGLIGCLVLIVALPPAAVITGVSVLVLGVAVRLVALRFS